jgi:hypothetical protein
MVGSEVKLMESFRRSVCAEWRKSRLGKVGPRMALNPFVLSHSAGVKLSRSSVSEASLVFSQFANPLFQGCLIFLLHLRKGDSHYHDPVNVITLPRTNSM